LRRGAAGGEVSERGRGLNSDCRMPIAESEKVVRTADLKVRTKQFALRVMKLIDALPRTIQGRAIANQIIRSATSVAANYRAACRARSRAEFVAKIGVVEEEADESCFWLELIIDSGLLTQERIVPLLTEARELVAIMAASRKSAIGNRKSAIQ
jgi:four helix bundle protein